MVPKDVHAVDVDHVTTILDNVSATLVFTGKKKKYTFFKISFFDSFVLLSKKKRTYVFCNTKEFVADGIHLFKIISVFLIFCFKCFFQQIPK